MSIIAKIKAKLISLLGGMPRNAYNEVEILFYKDCRHLGSHGMVVVSNKKMRLYRVSVPFIFPGLATPPVLTARLMQDIQSAAESQGYVFHHLVAEAYGSGVENDDLSAGQEGTREWDDLSESGSHFTFDSRNIDRYKVPTVQRPIRAYGESEVSSHNPGVSLGRAARDVIDERNMTNRKFAHSLLGVSSEDIDSYMQRWWADNNTRLSARVGLTLDQNQAVLELLEDRVAKAFVNREKVGVIDADLDEILSTYLKGIGRSIQTARGKHLAGAAMPPVSLSKLKEGSTMAQIQMMEAIMGEYFPHEEFRALTQEQQEEIRSRVLMSVNNDTARNKSEQDIVSAVKNVITEFRRLHVPGVDALKFTRQNSKS